VEKENETWWLTERSDLFGMTVHIGGTRRAVRTKAGKRKLRLLGCGCCRLIWAHLTTPARHAVEVSERFADGEADKVEMAAAAKPLARMLRGSYDEDAPGAQTRTAAAMAAATVQHQGVGHEVNTYPLSLAGYLGPNDVADGIVCDLLRDIFGNPFRPVAFDPSWRTSTAVQLARRMYESRDFGPMPILADALQDAGCDHPDVLAHARGGGPHVRGCWVVDLVLGKA
jgi:hypothetical protein